MSFLKKVKRATANEIPSPIEIDFKKGGASTVEELVPYSNEVF